MHDNSRALTVKSFKQYAIDLFNTQQNRITRTSTVGFTASDKFIALFRKRNHLSMHKPKVTKRLSIKAQSSISGDEFLFRTQVTNAVINYGPRFVLNADETPAKTIGNQLSKVIAPINSKTPRILSEGDKKQSITVLPTISANGSKLPLVVVGKGKTDRSLNKYELGNNIVGYYTESGWTTEKTMLDYLDDIIVPYTKKKPCALLLDSFGAHFTELVKDKAEQLNIELIKIPESQTATLQPLDINVNGPMKRISDSIWSEQKQLIPELSDSYSAAVKRTKIAFEKIDRKTIINCFKSICPII